MNAQTIRFCEKDLTLFCEASGDRNPLHLMEDYASKTAYGQRVVYGALGAMACLGHLKVPSHQSISKMTADFHRPMFLHVDYRMEKSGSADTQVVRLFDGTTSILTLTVTCKQAVGSQRSSDFQPGVFERSEARELRWAEVETGMEFSGHYAAHAGKLRELCRQWNVTVNSFTAEALLWSSYFIGMEFPGRDALFFRFLLEFSQEFTSQQPLRYHGVVSGLNKAVEQAKIRITLSSDELPFASGLLTAFIRPKLNAFDFQHLPLQSPAVDSLKDKVAVVIGASRGLGAALTALTALEGAHVVAVSRSPVELSAAIPSYVREKIIWESCNSADLESVCALQKRVEDQFGKLDLLICNAFPPIPALRLEANALTRLQAYLKQSTDLVLVPLCVFLPLLDRHHGCAVVISSSAVEKPVRDWPHYVAAKSAIESFGSVAPLQYPNMSTLIVRPERLLTDMTNTPMGRQNAILPVMFARQLVKRLQFPPVPGTVEIFHGDREEFANH